LHPAIGALLAATILAPIAFFSIRHVGIDTKLLLLALCLIASMTGVCSAWLSSLLNRARHEIVRDGCRGALIGSLASAGLLVAFCRGFEGVIVSIFALVAVVPCILPAAFCGLIAAVLTVIALNPPLTVEEVSTGGSRLPTGVAVLIAVIGFLSPLLPASPAPPPKPIELPPPVEEPKPVFVPAPRPEPVAPVPVFQYEVPRDFKSATAGEISIVSPKSFGRIEPGSPVVISGGSRFLAFQPATNQGMVEVVDLHRAATVGRFSPGGKVGSLSLSPDGKRLICDMPAEFIRLVVIEIESGRITPLPLPKGRAMPAGELLWWEDTEVLVFPEGKPPVALNLDTLLISDADQSVRWSGLTKEKRGEVRQSGLAAFSGSSWQPKKAVRLLTAELPETQGTAEWDMTTGNQWGLEDKLKPFINLSLDIPRGDADRVLMSPDHAKLVLVRNDALMVLYLGTTAKPPPAYSIEMRLKADACVDHEAIQKAMETRDLSAFVYAPMVNPLNGKVVGPDRAHIKAHLRFAKWDGDKAKVWAHTLFRAVASGDIVADLHVFSEQDGDLLAVEKKRPWWTTLDDKSAEAAGEVPTNEELAKLKTASEARHPQPSSALPAAPVPPANEPSSQNVNVKAIRDFVLAHHKKATEGNIAGMVADYADKVDHFQNGVVDRDFILKDEIAYHAKYIYVDEEVKGEIKTRDLPNGVVEVSYLLLVSWQKRADNELGGGEFDVTLEVGKADGRLQILKHRSTKRNP
jgi:hypothetical protein